MVAFLQSALGFAIIVLPILHVLAVRDTEVMDSRPPANR